MCSITYINFSIVPESNMYCKAYDKFKRHKRRLILNAKQSKNIQAILEIENQ